MGETYGKSMFFQRASATLKQFDSRISHVRCPNAIQMNGYETLVAFSVWQKVFPQVSAGKF